MTKKLICEQCGKEYTKKNYYDKHLEMHENEKKKNIAAVKKAEAIIDKKVKEIQKEKDKILTPSEKSFWKSFWGSMESMRQQNSIMIEHLREIREYTLIQGNLSKALLVEIRNMRSHLSEIQDNTNIDKETKLRLMNLIENSLKLYDKMRDLQKTQPAKPKPKEEPENEDKIIEQAIEFESEVTETTESFPGFVEDNPFSEEVNEFTEMEENEVEEFVSADTLKGKKLKADDNQCLLKASIKGETAKAVLLNFESGEYWIPKSTIKSEFKSEKNVNQQFIIDKWIIDKNNILGG